MPYKCVNNIMGGECSGEPKWKVPPKGVDPHSSKDDWLAGGECKKDPKTCGQFISYKEEK